MARLPNVNRDELKPEDQQYFDEIVGSRGSVRGPYGILLHSPQLAARVAHTGTFVRFDLQYPLDFVVFFAPDAVAPARWTEASCGFERNYFYVGDLHAWSDPIVALFGSTSSASTMTGMIVEYDRLDEGSEWPQGTPLLPHRVCAQDVGLSHSFIPRSCRPQPTKPGVSPRSTRCIRLSIR